MFPLILNSDILIGKGGKRKGEGEIECENI